MKFKDLEAITYKSLLSLLKSVLLPLRDLLALLDNIFSLTMKYLIGLKVDKSELLSILSPNQVPRTWRCTPSFTQR